MNYVIQTVLKNPRRPECEQITIPFPIPVNQYDQTIEKLQTADLGFSVNRDCAVVGVDSWYKVLNALVGTLVNIDQLDYLAKRLDSFSAGEASQFQAMAHKLELTDIKDFINLTHCCQQATVITDFSDLGAVGRSHFINLNGSGARIEDLENLDGKETALLLIDGGGGVITPYGVVYDNGMVLEQQYNGHQFPAYPYDGLFMVLEITPKRGLAEGKKPGDMMAVQQLAENLDQFDFIPEIHTPEEYGRYMIQESGHFDYNEALEGFYDYRRYSEQRVRQEGGQFNECGYVAYHGTMTLEEFMMEDPAEQYQREQEPQMGGLS